jgi:hypothetical protein
MHLAERLCQIDDIEAMRVDTFTTAAGDDDGNARMDPANGLDVPFRSVGHRQIRDDQIERLFRKHLQCLGT